jgi:MinD-like ATPase involved in chromosome partitioning or flagellar assembly
LLIACWSPKGGSGTTVVAAALGLVLARAAPSGALLADLAGDLPTVLGLAAATTGLGLADWLAAGPDVPDDALGRLELDAGPHLRLLPWRGRPGAPVAVGGRGEALAASLSADPRPVVADCGAAGADATLAVAASATVSLLVIRPCYLALRRALDAPLRPSGVVLVTEEGRSLGRADVEDVLGVPVRAEVRVDPTVARAVDAGLLASRLPRGLERSLRPALHALAAHSTGTPSTGTGSAA